MFRAASVASTLSVIDDWANADETATKIRIAVRQTLRIGFIDLLNQEVSAATNRPRRSTSKHVAICVEVGNDAVELSTSLECADLSALWPKAPTSQCIQGSAR